MKKSPVLAAVAVSLSAILSLATSALAQSDTSPIYYYLSQISPSTMQDQHKALGRVPA